MDIVHANRVQVSIIPASRISTKLSPEIVIFSPDATKVTINITKDGRKLYNHTFILDKTKLVNKISLDFSGIKGEILFMLTFYGENEDILDTRKFNYEFIDSVCNSTTLIDGCWISIYHWSEDEARWFNGALKTMSDEDWKQQIYAMRDIGINGIVIQNLFHSSEYVGQHEMNCESYSGEAFYPSEIYAKRAPIAAQDSLKAILTAADEAGMNVLVGIGLYAWFDFSPESLEWHKRITQEIFNKYGHHQSLYGWYVSEEIMGSLYYDYPPVADEKYKDIVSFFKEYKLFVQNLTPTKPVALAPNNIRFQYYENEWKEILENVDILLPFAFARDLDNLNIDEIAQICRGCNTHFWVDMEMFAWPLDNGLVPKTCNDLIKEIRLYDKLEQIYGYQFTGIMNPPESTLMLGRQDAKALYEEYRKYFTGKRRY